MLLMHLLERLQSFFRVMGMKLGTYRTSLYITSMVKAYSASVERSAFMHVLVFARVRAHVRFYFTLYTSDYIVDYR
jgi:hypothetical protein